MGSTNPKEQDTLIDDLIKINSYLVTQNEAYKKELDNLLASLTQETEENGSHSEP